MSAVHLPTLCDCSPIKALILVSRVISSNKHMVHALQGLCLGWFSPLTSLHWQLHFCQLVGTMLGSCSYGSRVCTCSGVLAAVGRRGNQLTEVYVMI